MNMHGQEDWFTSNHIHDTATMEYDKPLFIGEMLIFTGSNYLVDTNR